MWWSYHQCRAPAETTTAHINCICPPSKFLCSFRCVAHFREHGNRNLLNNPPLMPSTIVVPWRPHLWTRTTSLRGNVLLLLLSSVIIVLPSTPPPCTAFHHHLSYPTALIDCYISVNSDAFISPQLTPFLSINLQFTPFYVCHINHDKTLCGVMRSAHQPHGLRPNQAHASSPMVCGWHLCT